MATKQDLMGLGLPPFLAEKLGYTPQGYSGSAGITTQSSATQINDKLALLTVATSTASSFLLPQNPSGGVILYATNLFASIATASVYPATGNLLNGVTNGSLTLTTGQSAIFITESAGTALNVNWYSIKSA